MRHKNRHKAVNSTSCRAVYQVSGYLDQSFHGIRVHCQYCSTYAHPCALHELDLKYNNPYIRKGLLNNVSTSILIGEDTVSDQEDDLLPFVYKNDFRYLIHDHTLTMSSKTCTVE